MITVSSIKLIVVHMFKKLSAFYGHTSYVNKVKGGQSWTL